MPTAMTFATLKQDVQRYLERGATLASDPVVFEQIPRSSTSRSVASPAS